ncbi:unnamed protein product [Rotaria socialis]|uniref:VCBS repeat-containing protein n=1 Tax=Rotaria socialis TaxID=392032 RepID=A0A821C0M9_9BILA|nr:unnamed protein product [Rotaria socialis]CAF4603039.1 unnamed protein product [Rotaria socialis]
MIPLPTDPGPITVKAADFDNDRFLDLVVTNYDGDTTSIFLGYGNGGFKKQIDLLNRPGAKPLGIAIGDINKNNQLDVVVANRNASNVGVFFGQGHEMFSTQTTFSTGIGSTPVGLALGDLNNDNVLDLVVTDHENGRLVVFLGTDTGTLTEKAVLVTGHRAESYLVITYDFNKDHLLDIAVGDGD